MQRRPLRLVDLDAVAREVDSLLDHGYDRMGNWSLGENCDHLARVIAMSLDGYPSMLPAPIRWIMRWVALRKILRHEMIARSIPAPNYLKPESQISDGEGVQRLKAALARFKSHEGQPVHPSPALGKLTYEQCREVHLWHCEHHLSFLRPRSAWE